MANALYDAGREGFLGGTEDWDTDNIKCMLVDHGTYTPNVTTDSNLSDIIAGARIATSGNLTTKTITNGVADAADVTFTAVSGASVESINIFFSSGVESTSTLLVFIDTAAGLPVTPNGGDITSQWDNGANKIFKL